MLFNSVSMFHHAFLLFLTLLNFGHLFTCTFLSINLVPKAASVCYVNVLSRLVMMEGLNVNYLNYLYLGL